MRLISFDRMRAPCWKGMHKTCWGVDTQAYKSYLVFPSGRYSQHSSSFTLVSKRVRLTVSDCPCRTSTRSKFLTQDEWHAHQMSSLECFAVVGVQYLQWRRCYDKLNLRLSQTCSSTSCRAQAQSAFHMTISYFSTLSRAAL